MVPVFGKANPGARQFGAPSCGATDPAPFSGGGGRLPAAHNTAAKGEVAL